MTFSVLFGHPHPTPDKVPGFIRSIEDVNGVRVVRLQGPVGKDIGGQVRQANDIAEDGGAVFERPLLLDFRGTTECDFSTIAYMVQALRERMASGAGVGIINAPPTLIAEMQIAKLEGVFRVFASEQEAIAGLLDPDRA